MVKINDAVPDTKVLHFVGKAKLQLPAPSPPTTEAPQDTTGIFQQRRQKTCGNSTIFLTIPHPNNLSVDINCLYLALALIEVMVLHHTSILCPTHELHAILQLPPTHSTLALAPTPHHPPASYALTSFTCAGTPHPPPKKKPLTPSTHLTNPFHPSIAAQHCHRS